MTTTVEKAGEGMQTINRGIQKLKKLHLKNSWMLLSHVISESVNMESNIINGGTSRLSSHH